MARHGHHQKCNQEKKRALFYLRRHAERQREQWFIFENVEIKMLQAYATIAKGNQSDCHKGSGLVNLQFRLSNPLYFSGCHFCLNSSWIPRIVILLLQWHHDNNHITNFQAIKTSWGQLGPTEADLRNGSTRPVWPWLAVHSACSFLFPPPCNSKALASSSGCLGCVRDKPIILAFGKQRQKDRRQCEAKLAYIGSSRHSESTALRKLWQKIVTSKQVRATYTVRAYFKNQGWGGSRGHGRWGRNLANFVINSLQNN